MTYAQNNVKNYENNVKFVTIPPPTHPPKKSCFFVPFHSSCHIQPFPMHDFSVVVKDDQHFTGLNVSTLYHVTVIVDWMREEPTDVLLICTLNPCVLLAFEWFDFLCRKDSQSELKNKNPHILKVCCPLICQNIFLSVCVCLRSFCFLM